MSVAPLPRLVSALPAAKKKRYVVATRASGTAFLLADIYCCCYCCWAPSPAQPRAPLGGTVLYSYEYSVERGHCVIGNDYAVPGLLCEKVARLCDGALRGSQRRETSFGNNPCCEGFGRKPCVRKDNERATSSCIGGGLAFSEIDCSRLRDTFRVSSA